MLERTEAETKRELGKALEKARKDQTGGGSR